MHGEKAFYEDPLKGIVDNSGPMSMRIFKGSNLVSKRK